MFSPPRSWDPQGVRRLGETIWICLVLALAACGGLRARPCATAEPPAALAGAVWSEALPAISRGDYLGLGPEAARLGGWIASLPQPPSVELHRRTLCVRDRSGAQAQVSARLAGALARLGQWYGLTAATLAHPVTAAELGTAARSPASVERIADVFERSIGRGFWLGGRFKVPETGGEANLDGELWLRERADPAWDVARALSGRLDDEQAIAALWDARQAELAGLDNGRVLEFALRHWRLGGPALGRAVRSAATTLVENASSAYSLSPQDQFRLIVESDWRGRYVGRWHTHPPHYAETGWSGGDVPSYQDMQNAVQDGQFLTVAFQPDGFDLYDASVLGEAGRVDLSLLRVTRYRAPFWEQRFERLRERLAGR